MSSKPPRALTTRLARGFAACPSEAAAYGKCVVAHVDTIAQGVCAAEFQQLQRCVQQQVSSDLSNTAHSSAASTTAHDDFSCLCCAPVAAEGRKHKAVTWDWIADELVGIYTTHHEAPTQIFKSRQLPASDWWQKVAAATIAETEAAC
jgi:hypothetical protein